MISTSNHIDYKWIRSKYPEGEQLMYYYRPNPSFTDLLVYPLNLGLQHIGKVFSSEIPTAQRIRHLAWGILELTPMITYPISYLDTRLHQCTLYDALAPFWADAPEFAGSPVPRPFQPLNDLQETLDDPIMPHPLMRAIDVDGNPVLLFKAPDNRLFLAIHQDGALCIQRPYHHIVCGGERFGVHKHFTSQDVQEVLDSIPELKASIERKTEIARFEIARPIFIKHLIPALAEYIRPFCLRS